MLIGNQSSIFNTILCKSVLILDTYLCVEIFFFWISSCLEVGVRSIGAKADLTAQYAAALKKPLIDTLTLKQNMSLCFVNGYFFS